MNIFKNKSCTKYRGNIVGIGEQLKHTVKAIQRPTQNEYKKINQTHRMLCTK